MNTSDLEPLPAHPSLEQYRKQAKEFVKACKSGDPGALRRIESHHPRAARLLASGVPNVRVPLAEAQLVIAREHGFESWPKFAQHVEALTRASSPISRFEVAADAIVAGDIATLASLLSQDPELVRARSTRVHRATLLHYIGANGVENFRQRSPPTAVAVANALLDAGAAVDALADSYGKSTTLGLVATSVHPAGAGVQLALLETLLAHGAAVDGVPGGRTPLIAALHNGRPEAAELLATRGARLDLEGAAGVGRLDLVKRFFAENGGLKPNATPAQMKAGFLWACSYGRGSVVEFLLRSGIDVGAHLHGETGLHGAALGGHVEIVELLLGCQAPVDVEDDRFGGTPLGWALYGWGNPAPESRRARHHEVVALLVAAGAAVEPQWLAGEKVRADPRMLAALTDAPPR
ncbi:MAG TPA: ankyrin repeat domain-containing protein [Thermoanaerobaculia bacterium]|nr:ankyrin repeat domain-containing protein [Thermoanaerobaculia bacterium]